MVEPGSHDDIDHFNADRYCEAIAKLAENTENLDIQAWSDFVYETVNLFRSMGSAMGMAFSDLTSKAAIIRDNKKHMAEDLKCPEATESLQKFCLKEEELQVLQLNGDNNKKHVKDKHDWKYKYTSTARTVTRNLWLMDFIFELMRTLAEDHAIELNKAVKHAYDVGLGPHHPWVIRKAAGLAMKAAPYRKGFMEHNKIEQHHMEQMRDNLLTVKTVMWEFHKSKKWDELP